MSKMTPHQRRKLGYLGPAFPELRKKVDVADSENHAVRHVQKYLRDHRISGIQNQMYIIMALHAEEVFTDRIYYCLHQLVAGNRGTADLKDPFGPHNDYGPDGKQIIGGKGHLRPQKPSY